LDNLTHTLVGVGLANAFFKKRVGPEAVPVLAWSSNLPDIDAAVMLFPDPAVITLRRTFGHSIFLFPVWAAALAWFFSRRYPKQRFTVLFGLCLLGAGTHVFFDLINSFGVVVLWPFSLWRPELASVFIVDLILLGLLAAPLVLARLRGREGLERYSRFSMAAVAVYLLFCMGSRLTAMDALAAKTQGEPREFSYVFPEPLGPHRWRGVQRQGDDYEVFLIHTFNGEVELKERIKTFPNDPMVLKARQSPLGRRLEAFFKAPVWTADWHFSVDENAHVAPPTGVTVYDLRFKSLVFPRHKGFQFHLR